MRNRVAYVTEFLKNPKGSMTVEFVAFAPLLLAALMIAFEFGRAFWAYDIVTRDLRGAVRYLARNSATPPPYASDACPTSAQNIAQTGLPGDGTDANKHFPWKGVSATFLCPSAAFTGVNYNDAGYVVTMTATVPVQLSLLEVLNQLSEWVNSAARAPADSSIGVNYSLIVSYQARYIGN